MAKKPLILVILDGFGDSKEEYANAIVAAKTPNIDKIFKNCPTTRIDASGLAVGLPKGQMGNSEVGHTNIGAGRVVYQDLTRITRAIQSGEFFKNEVLIQAMQNCKKNSSALHIMGLLSDGGVHSHLAHLYGAIQMAKNFGLQNVYVHAFTDGRDVCPTSALNFLKDLEQKIEQIGVGKIATVSGRYYAMDRDNRWDRVEKAYMAIANGVGQKAKSAVEAVRLSYQNNITDEFVVPTVCVEDVSVSPSDSVIFTNFRPDRARELTRAFVCSNFSGFDRNGGALKPFFVCLTQYDETIKNVHVAFKPQTLENTFGECISNQGLSQLRIAETEKYAHVTFFFNGGREEKFENEDRVLIKSPNVATYDLKPQMSAYLVTDEVIKRIESKKYDVIILNYANCDMVGHTGIFDATVKAVEVVDECVGKVLKATEKANGVMIITADHGNAEKMLDEENKPFTSHTTNPVKFAVVGYACELRKNGGKLADIAPTMLDILDMEKPAQMTGKSLIDSKNL